jgi:hypothetical protein
MRKFATIVLILIATAILWYKWSFPTVSYRYRLTVAVEAGGQVHTGSSVIEVDYQFWPELFQRLVGGNPGQGSVRGQGVLIDLGAQGVLVAALGGENGDYCTVNALYLVGRAYEPANARRRCVSGYALSLENERALSQKQGPINLTPDNLPAFFWFANPADLASAREVKPADFASVIGDAARLVSAQIEITRDPVVIDIDKKLPAYTLLRGPPNNGNDYRTPDGLVLGWRQFISKGNE